MRSVGKARWKYRVSDLSINMGKNSTRYMGINSSKKELPFFLKISIKPIMPKIKAA